MFVLTLTLTDPEDAGYFTNKTLNKLHGYIQHTKVKFAIFFTIQSIQVYAADKQALEYLLENKAVCIDIRRHIFLPELKPVSSEYIKVFKRIHNIIYNVNKKVNKQINYYTKNNHLINKNNHTLIKEKKHQLRAYYQEKKQAQAQDKENRQYFIIKKDNNKKFTIWVEVQEIKVQDFLKTAFNSYGLLH